MATKTKPADKSASSYDPVSISPQMRKAAFIMFAFSGMAALIYEVLWTRELELIFGSTVYAVSMMLAAFMSGLSLGAVLGGRWADKSSSPVALFGLLELGIAVFGLLTLPLIQVLPSLYFYIYETLRPGFFMFFAIQLLLSFVIMLVPTTFMGATFPVVSKINTSSLSELGADVGGVYSINTLGAILGSLGAGFLLIPLLGVKATTFVAAGLNLAVALVMIYIAKSAVAVRWLAVGGAALVVIATIGTATQEAAFAQSFYALGRYNTQANFEEFKAQLKTLYMKDDIHGRIAVFEAADGVRHLQNSGKIEGSNDTLDRQTTSLLALLPIMSARDPQSVLVIGLGTGLTSLAALNADVKKVDTVEINKSVLTASRLFVGETIEKNPRASIYVNDARNFLYTTDARYDAITSEPSYPLSSHVSHLFTKEFYELAKSRLNKDGAYCQWLPRYLLNDEDSLMMLKTFQEVFPQMYVWGSNTDAAEAIDVMLIGINGERKLDPKEVADRVQKAAGQQLYFGFFGDPDSIAELVKDPQIPINTDDKPLLEFRTPRNYIERYREASGIFAQ